MKVRIREEIDDIIQGLNESIQLQISLGRIFVGVRRTLYVLTHN